MTGLQSIRALGRTPYGFPAAPTGAAPLPPPWVSAVVDAPWLQGEGQIGVKSALGLARAMAAHPDAVLAFLENISVSPRP